MEILSLRENLQSSRGNPKKSIMSLNPIKSLESFIDSAESLCDSNGDFRGDLIKKILLNFAKLRKIAIFSLLPRHR